MAEEQVQEKDNFWFIIAGVIVATIVLVLVLKGRETEHLKSGAVAELQKETFSKIEARKTSNVTGTQGN
ncbi:MAG: hypothetical protein PHF31_11080 [Methylobacter sp.]|nr:hypothetical protein [Methylobacter sp.]